MKNEKLIIDKYILTHIDKEGELLSELYREAHVKLVRPRMISGHLQGRILKMFCRMVAPKRILETGTYTGYATLCMAEALPDDGVIHTIEINDEMEDFIREQFDRSEHRKKIVLHIGDALSIIPNLEDTFDLAFIDADKREYCRYYDLIFDKVRPGGIIIADNTLWNGKVLAGIPHADAQTAGILRFNEKIAADKRIEKVIIPVRDGLTIIYKR
ncbi:MAG: O-methyltransferase [Dysgonamonadaceae bacterium]|jgi:predicted O-methyltransferase YrrM|nr:O-methyltransferase [Dysgonamonadaceae bacterium]